MNELRWILLIAGALLIAGIYAWGIRSRQRGSPDRDARRTSAFDATALPDEPTMPVPGAGAPDAAAAAFDPRGTRRLEPSVTLDDEVDSTPAISRRSDFLATGDDDATAHKAPSVRREPTIGLRPEAPSARDAGPSFDAPAVEQGPPPGQGLARAAHEPPPSPPPVPAPATAAEPARPKRPPQKIFALRVVAVAGGRFSGERVLDALTAEGLRFGRYDVFHRLHDDGRPVFSVASLKEPGTFDVGAMGETQYPGVLVFSVLPGPVPAAEAFDEMLFAARAFATHLGGALADERGTPLTTQRAGLLRDEALEFERAVAAGAA